MRPIPDHLISLMLEGASPVRVLRHYRGMTQNELARAAGLQPARLRRIEETKRLQEGEAEQIARALRVSKCSLEGVRGRFKGCDDALHNCDDEHTV